MSFDHPKEKVAVGDTIVMLMGREPVSIEIDETKTHQSKFGAFPHKNFIGKNYGSKVYSSNGKGWVYILQPTPELWTVTLPHRTQILYTMDISMITFELELKPGSIVVESGTGSGSLSHAIIRTIKPTGHLYTFDFHQNRVLKAKEEFDKHYGTDKYVTCQCADACADGFSLTDKADAVFLDLPAPWDAIPHAKAALKKSGSRICSFSPCIEQVQKTCQALRKERFCEIKTIECLVRPLNITTTPIPEIEFCNDVSILEKKDEVEAKKMKLEPDTESIRKENGEGDELNSAEPMTDVTDEAPSGNGAPSCTNKDEMEARKRKLEPGTESVEKENGHGDNKNNSAEPITNVADEASSGNGAKITGLNSYGMVTKLTAKNKKGNINVLTCKPNKEVTGHTGYLTFASLYPYAG